VAELRGLTEYLQHGAADFEAMLRLERAAQRKARAALLNTLGLIVLIRCRWRGCSGNCSCPRCWRLCWAGWLAACWRVICFGD
jgi:hypothetical protein